MRKIFNIIAVLLILSIPDFGSCQNQSENSGMYFCLEEPPTFPGGDKALSNFINSNQVYPDNWRADSVEGRVFVTFIVDSTGSIQNPKILKGLDPTLDSIALMIIRKMPKWSPGKQRNKPVAVQLNLPIKFGSGNKESKNKLKNGG